jgi:hypothetical protein
MLWTKKRLSSSRPTSLAPIFLLAFSGTAVVIAMSWAIKGLDIVLHSRITPSLIFHTINFNQLPSNAAIVDGCVDPNTPLCPVVNRTNAGYLGGRNQSDTFHVYPQAGQTNSSVGSLVYIAPSSLSPKISIEGAHTYAAGTTCQFYRPDISLGGSGPNNTMNIGQAGASADPSSGHASMPFNMTISNSKMQTYLLSQGDVNNGRMPYNGANINPLTFATWACFDDYSHTQYDEETPFVDWWPTVTGTIQDIPRLCSITFCNTTLYDATYSAYGNNWAVDVGSMQLANKSATLALSGAAVWLNLTFDRGTQRYDESHNFMDEMLQVDFSAAGNSHGGDLAYFGSMWAMGLSSRLLGWSAGAVELRPYDQGTVLSHEAIPAISIDLAPAYAFIALHFAYAAMIALLGISCAFIPARYAVTEAPVDVDDGGSRSTWDTRAAQAKLSDFSTLVTEVLSNRETLGIRRGATQMSDLGQVNGHEAEKRVRLGLRATPNGGLGLHFHE